MRGTQASRWTGLIACAAAALVATGCGSDEKAAKAAPLAITATDGKGGLAYRAPRRVRAGLVKLTLKNEGRRAHKAQLFRIEGNHSIREALRVRGRLPRWLFWEGGVGVARRGGRASATQRLRAGRYFITGNRGDKARVASLTVVGNESDGGLPDTTASIVTREYSFTARGFRSGANKVEFSNDGLEPHHVVVAPVKPGSSVAELRRFLRGSGPIPVGKTVNLHGALETSVLEAGQRQAISLDLKRGKYALLCFVPDRSGGPAHVVKGMVDELTVR